MTDTTQKPLGRQLSDNTTPGAKSTMDFRGGRGPFKLLVRPVGAGIPGPKTDEEGDARTDTIPPTPTMLPIRGGGTVKDGEKDEKNKEGNLKAREKRNMKYLPFTNVHALISETLDRDKKEWFGNAKKTMDVVEEAVELLAKRRETGDNSDYTSAKFSLIRGFKSIARDNAKFYDFEIWRSEKEIHYERAAGAYRELNLSSFTPYNQAMERNLGELPEAAAEFYRLIGNSAAVDGTDVAEEDMVVRLDLLTGREYSRVGELEKIEFDGWLQSWVPVEKSSIKAEGVTAPSVEKSEVPEEEGPMLALRDDALRRVGEILETVENMKTNHNARVGRMQKTLDRVDDESAMLEEKNYRLETLDRKRTVLIAEQAESTKQLINELAELRKQNELIINQNKALARERNALTERVGSLETTMLGRMQARAAAQKDLGTRETEAPPEPKPIVPPARESGSLHPARVSRETVKRESIRLGAGVEERLGRITYSAAAAMQEKDLEPTPAPETVGEAVGAREEQLEVLELKDVDGEDIDELPDLTDSIIPEPEKRGRFWATRPGMAVHAIFVYGFARKGGRQQTPAEPEVSAHRALTETTGVHEINKAQWDEYDEAKKEYNCWYNKTGRWLKDRPTISEAIGRIPRKVKYVAAGAVTVAAAVTIGVVGTHFAGVAQESAEQRAQKEIAKTPAALIETEVPESAAASGEESGFKDAKKVEAKAMPPLQKPVLEDVLAAHNLKLGKKTNIAQFYENKKMGGVEDVQERYVILGEILKTEKQLEKYERSYREKPIVEMYGDFLKTAMAYAQLEGQTDAEKANVSKIGRIVAKRLLKKLRDGGIRKDLGKRGTAELKATAEGFQEFANGLPEVNDVQEEKLMEVVTPEELKEMKKAGEELETPVIILPDKTDEKPFDVEKEMGKVVKAEFKSLDSPSKVNEFNKKADKAKKIEEKFLLRAHLTGQLVENGMEAKMSERRVLFMHIDTMNAAIKFAMADGQGMPAIAFASITFNLANREVKKLLGYKKMQRDLGKRKGAIDKNVKWNRERAKELKNKVDAYERNKDRLVPLPGSPALNNGNGAPTAIPEKVQLEKGNQFIAMQVAVFSKHGLSIFEHPLKVYKKMKGMKINNFDKFIILENLVGKVKGNSMLMDGLTKAEQFDMLRILAAYLRATTNAANEPRNWADGYTRDDILLYSLAIDVSELLEEIRKLGKGHLVEDQKHLRFQMDTETFEELGRAINEFDEQLRYEYRQKQRRKDTNGE